MFFNCSNKQIEEKKIGIRKERLNLEIEIHGKDFLWHIWLKQS